MKVKQISCRSPTLVTFDVRNCKWVLLLKMIGREMLPTTEW